MHSCSSSGTPQTGIQVQEMCNLACLQDAHLPISASAPERSTPGCAGGGAGAAGAYGSAQGVRDLLGGLWATVHVQQPSATEQLAILQAAQPVLAGGPLLPGGLAALALVKRAAGQEPPGSLGTHEVAPLSTQKS